MYYNKFMKLDQVECFISLAETLNFTETAVFLGLTQPSISRKIQALEETLQSSLFVRTKHSVQLSPSGQDFLRKVKPLYLQFDSILKHTQDSLNTISGPLRIGVLPEIGKHFFFSLFQEFRNQYPEILLQVNYSLYQDHLPRLIDGKLDFVIGNQLPPSELYRSYKMLNEKSIMVTRTKNNQLKSFKNITNQELSLQSFVGYSPQDGLLNLFLKSFYRPLDISKLEKLSCVNDHASMIQILLQTNSLAVLPQFSVENFLKSGELIQVGNHEKVNPFYLIELNKNWRTKKEQEFRSFLISSTKKHQ